MKKQDLIKKIEREQKGALKECWGRYEKMIITEQHSKFDVNAFKMAFNDLPKYLQNMDMYDFEDVAFYAGYVRGLEQAKKYICKDKFYGIDEKSKVIFDDLDE
jgi:hypothetical protein